MPGHDEALRELREDVGAAVRNLMPAEDISRLYADALDKRRAQLAALDATLAELERGRRVIAKLQLFAAEKYAEARDLADDAGHYATAMAVPECREGYLWRRALAVDAQTEAAIVSALVRQGLGIEPDGEP